MDIPPRNVDLKNTNRYQRGHLLSKLSQLKQEAYQAGKKRDWELAVSIYEQILAIDKNNPMVINEMGDLCLKAGETPRAVRQFLGAASRYRSTGLLNNAVAIYKKILRYDPENQSAHWYLAETRASQGLLVEGEENAIRFLENSEQVSGDIKEIFLKRCVKLFDLYGTSKLILDKLLQIFRMWDMHLESSRTACLLGCFMWDEGEQDAARSTAAEIRARTPEISNYPEYQRLAAKIDPEAASRTKLAADVHSISLDDPVPEPDEAPAAQTAKADDPLSLEPALPTAAPAVEVDEPEVDPGARDEISFADVSVELPLPEVEKNETGFIELDIDDGSSFEDLVAAAASGLQLPAEPEEETPVAAMAIDLDDEAPAEPEKVDLLAQILADDDNDSMAGHADSQVEAISEDIGSQVGGAVGEQDSASLYEMGLVYLDMGMFDQAVQSFEKAALDPEYTARSYEMCGITLLKAQRPSDAVIALQKGLEGTDSGSREYLGLQYHLGQAFEENGQENEAIAMYQAIQQTEPRFLDVGERLANLSTV